MTPHVVELLPLPPDQSLVSTIPPNYTLAKVEEVWSKHANKDMIAIFCVVEKMEEQITNAKHLVMVNRTRCILKEISSPSRSYCYFFGKYSNSMTRLGVMENDLVMICSPTVVRTKMKPKQVLPPGLSSWTIHCLEKDPELRVTFFRQKETEQNIMEGVNLTDPFLVNEEKQKIQDEDQEVVTLNTSLEQGFT